MKFSQNRSNRRKYPFGLITLCLLIIGLTVMVVTIGWKRLVFPVPASSVAFVTQDVSGLSIQEQKK